jgi:hypothetical protein
MMGMVMVIDAFHCGQHFWVSELFHRQFSGTMGAYSMLYYVGRLDQ